MVAVAVYGSAVIAALVLAAFDLWRQNRRDPGWRDTRPTPRRSLLALVAVEAIVVLIWHFLNLSGPWLAFMAAFMAGLVFAPEIWARAERPRRRASHAL